MAELKGRPVGILGTGMCVPERVVTNDDISKLVDTSDEWIRSHTGIRERRVIDEGMRNSDMAASAARDALRDAGVSAESLDMVVVGTNSPDTIFPGVGPIVQGAIGAVNAGGMDVQSGCPGGLHALAAASSGVAAGIWDHTAVIGSEALTPFIDWSDRNTCPLFGDGAAALIVGEWRPGAIKVAHMKFGADGTKSDMIVLPAGMSSLPASEETVRDKKHFIEMHGHDVYKFVNRILPPFIEEFCSSCGIEPSEPDLWIFHQANVRILDGLAKRLGIPQERSVINLDRYGNTSAASIFIGLHESRAAGRIRPGMRIMTVSFGAGMTHGAVLLES